MKNSLIKFAGTSENYDKVEEFNIILNHIKTNREANQSASSGEIVPIKRTGIYDLFRTLFDSENFSNEIDEESYLFDFLETARMFEDFLDETYVIF